MGNSPLEQAVGDGVKGTFITFSVYSLVFLIANLKCVSDLPKARALKNYKIVNDVNIFWRFVAVGNG